MKNLQYFFLIFLLSFTFGMENEDSQSEQQPDNDIFNNTNLNQLNPQEVQTEENVIGSHDSEIEQVQQNAPELKKEEEEEYLYETPAHYVPTGTKTDLTNWEITPEHFHKVQEKLNYINKPKTQNVEIMPGFLPSYLTNFNQQHFLDESNEFLSFETFNDVPKPKNSSCKKSLFKMANEFDVTQSPLNEFHSMENELNLIPNVKSNRLIEIESDNLLGQNLENYIEKDFEDFGYDFDTPPLKKEIDAKDQDLLLNAPKKESNETEEMKEKVNKLFLDEKKNKKKDYNYD